MRRVGLLNDWHDLDILHIDLGAAVAMYSSCEVDARNAASAEPRSLEGIREIPEGVQNRHHPVRVAMRPIGFGRLQNVRVVTDDGVDAHLGQMVRNLDLLRPWIEFELHSPVELRDDEFGPFPPTVLELFAHL